ncbi:hypothetical protein [Endozoicomonas numazuensis]|uniref:hypothetical protein n=1 Tax=Endozoicomonas numazuensis TaxID=1137799 RepID=UPI000A91F1A7|nr:hypothetical protein [Endozoicomonas numazuensis]
MMKQSRKLQTTVLCRCLTYTQQIGRSVAPALSPDTDMLLNISRGQATFLHDLRHR